jgi:hypothetical protein
LQHHLLQHHFNTASALEWQWGLGFLAEQRLVVGVWNAWAVE